MNLGRWSAFVLLPVILFLERFSYYGLRTVLFQEVMVDGGDIDTVRTHIQYVSWMVAVTPPIGGLIGLLLKPRWTLVAGAFVCSLGYALLFALGASSLVAFAVLAIGMGLVRPAVFTALALAARDPDESARGASFLVAYAATNVGAMASSAIGSLLDSSGGGEMRPFTIFSMSGLVLLLLAALLSLAVAIAPRFGEVKEPPDPPFTGRGEAGALLVMVGVLPATIAMSFAEAMQFPALYRSSSGFSQWIFYVNPAAVLGVSVIVGALLATAAISGKRIPALHAVAGGMIVCALASIPLALVGTGDEEAAQAGAFLSLVMMAVAETLIYPLAMARIASGPHPRSATLVAGVWLAVIGISGQAQTLLLREAGSDETKIAGVLLAVTAILSVLLAIGLAALQWFAGAKLWPGARQDTRPADDDAPTLAPG